MAALEKEIVPPENSLLAKFVLAASVSAAAQHLKALLSKVPNEVELTASFSAAFKSIIEANGEAAPTGDDEREARVVALLAEKQAKTFPLKGFDRKTLSGWAAPAPEKFETLHRFGRSAGRSLRKCAALRTCFARRSPCLPCMRPSIPSTARFAGPTH